MLSRKECQLALKRWQTAKGDIDEVLRLVPSHYVFTISGKSIEWLNKNNDNDRFHAYIGVHNNQSVMMLFPLDSSGGEMRLPEYAVSYLEPLSSELRFVEQEVKTVRKTAVLSTDLQISSREITETRPLYQHDIECQDTILEQIEDWRNDSADWFFKQISDSGGVSIFNVFNIPIEDISEGCTEITGLFAFKYSKVYGQILPTIIFVHHASKVLENQKLHSVQTNLYNWSQPCPPFCRPKGGFTLLED